MDNLMMILDTSLPIHQSYKISKVSQKLLSGQNQYLTLERYMVKYVRPEQIAMLYGVTSMVITSLTLHEIVEIPEAEWPWLLSL